MLSILANSGWRFGPDTIPSLEQIVQIIARFFQTYLFSLTSFLIYSIIVLVVLYHFQWPSSYGTQSKKKHIYRGLKSLLLVSAILPILYVAMWIGTGSTSSDSGLPHDGVFGTSLEERIIGPDPVSQGLGAFLDILSRLFQTYLLSATTIGVILVVGLVVLYYSNRWPAEYRVDLQRSKLKRIGAGLLGVCVIFPLLYTAAWIGTGSQRTPGSSLPADGVFGTEFEERLIGPELGEGLGGFLAILGNIFETYQVTFSFVLISILVFLGVSYAVLHWPFENHPIDKREQLHRAALGLGGSLAIVPILHAISWVAVGMSHASRSFSRVAPAVQLPTDILFGGSQYHPFIEELTATKDPVESILINFYSVQSSTYLMVGVVAIVLGLIVMVYFSRSSYIKTNFGRQSLRGGSMVVIFVFLIPGIVTSGAWLMTGVEDGGTAFSQNLAGTPFNHQDDFDTCSLEGWQTVSGGASPGPEARGEGCLLEVNGTIEETYDLTGTPQEQGFVNVFTDDEMTVRIYNGQSKVVDQEITSNRRFEIPVTEETRVEITADESELDKVEAGVRPLDDPYMVVEMNATNEEFVLRNGELHPEVRIYNIGSANSPDPLPYTLAIAGETVTGETKIIQKNLTTNQLQGGQWREIFPSYTNFGQNPPVGEVTLVAATDFSKDEVMRGPEFDNYALTNITIRYADFLVELPSNQTTGESELQLNPVVVNNGTATSPTTTTEVEIVDGQGNVVTTESLSVSEIQAGQSETLNFDHRFQTPGSYTVRTTVDDTPFPHGNRDQMHVQVNSGDLRTNIVSVDNSGRVGTNVSYTVQFSNAGNLQSNSTTAQVTITNSSGGAVSTRTVSIPALAPGEEVSRTLNTTVQETGPHTLRVNAHDPEFPTGTVDTVSFSGIGPDLTTRINAPDIGQGGQTDVTAVFENEGTDYTEATTADVELVAPNGSTIERTTVDVNRLSPGETQRVTPFQMTLNTTGVYEVHVNASVDFSPAGSRATESFEVVYSQLEAGVTLNDVEDTNEADVGISITNDGTGQSEPTTATLNVTNSNGTVVDQQTISVPALDPGETFSDTRRVTVDSPGQHTVDVDGPMITNGDDDESQAQFDATWPDLSGSIEANETQLDGYNVRFRATVSNDGTRSSEPTVANVTVMDESGSVVERRTLNIQSLSAGGQVTRALDVTLPEVGRYTARINVSDEDFPAGTVDTSEEVVVAMSDLRADVTAHDVPRGGREQINISVENTGEAESNATTALLTLENSSSVVVQKEIDIRSLASGEALEDTPISRTMEEPGQYSVTLNVTADDNSAGTRDTETFRVSGADLRANLIARDIDKEQQVDITTRIRNVGEVYSKETTAEVTLYHSNGTAIERTTLSVQQLSPDQTQVDSPFSRTIDRPGNYYATIDVAVEHNAQGSTARDNFEVHGTDLRASVSASDINRDQQADITTRIYNNGAASEPTNATVTLMTDDGTVVNRTTISVQSLARGEEQVNTPLPVQLTEPGDYRVTIDVEPEDNPRGTSGNARFTVNGADLQADVAANDIREGDQVDISASVENVGPVESEPAKATVTLRTESGTTLNQTQVNVSRLSSNERFEFTPFNRTLANPNDYVVTMSLNTSASSDRETFRVKYVDIRASISASDVSTDDDNQIEVSVFNQGTGSSEPVSGTVTLTDSSGTVVREWNISTGSISGGGTYRETLSHNFDEAGTYTATVDVQDQGRPRGTTDQTQFDMTWPDHQVSISATETTVHSNTTEAELTVENAGPGPSRSTTVTVSKYDRFGNVLGQQEVSVPALSSGETYSQTVQFHFIRPGTYSIGASVNDPELPEGNNDETGEISVVASNLQGNVVFLDDATEVGTNTTVSIDVTNAGNARSNTTDAHLTIRDDSGEVVVNRIVEFGEIASGDSKAKLIDVQLNSSGVNTAHLNVVDEEFPIGTQDQDQIEVLSPDLRADVSVEDTELNSKTSVTVTVENVGDTQADSTTAMVKFYNQNGNRVVREQINVEALAPGEQTTVTYDQLVDERCWKTEMSCAPGTTVGTGTYTAEVNVSVDFAPEGSVDTDQFHVSED